MDLSSISDEIGRRIFEAAADNSFNAITITEANADDLAGPIIYVNEAFTRMTGYGVDEVLGETPGVLQGPKTENAVLQRLADQVQKGEMFHGQTINYRKDGSEFLLEWSVTPVKNNGVTTHHVAVQRDIS